MFKQDLDRAEIVAFVGFNASDFHLNNVLVNVTGLRDKVYFINRSSAVPDLDVKRTQTKYGTPLYISRSGFAETLRGVLSGEPPEEPALSSFSRFTRGAPAVDIPETRAIEDLFVLGTVDEAQLARDIDGKLSDYHVGREVVEKVIYDLRGDVKVALVVGDICDGKTIAVKSLCRRLDVERPVFSLRIPYDDIMEEVPKILDAHPSAALVVENCFELSRERLVSLARLVNSASAVLILSGRTIAAEARAQDVAVLAQIPGFRQYRMDTLTRGEIAIVSKLADQIAGWSEFKIRSNFDRENFITKTCNASLPSFLLRLLRSEYVRDRYLEEYNKLTELSGVERGALVGALYIAHIGERPHVGFLSDVFNFDVGGLLLRLEKKSSGLRLMRLRGDIVETVPAVGATSILKEIVPDKLIVESVSGILRSLSEGNARDYFRRHIFSQMMRYSILQPVLQEDHWISRFFDNISKIDYVRRQVLFWLQWSIALREKGEFIDSEKKLEQGYREAEAYEQKSGKAFDRKQLEDVKAKLLMARARKTNIESPQLFRDIRSASEIVGRLLKDADLTHHPFQTLDAMANLLNDKSEILEGDLRAAARQNLRAVLQLAEKRVGNVPAGYQTFRASEALKSASSLLEKFSAA